jgi:transposase-like protein
MRIERSNQKRRGKRPQRFKCKSCGYHYTVAKVGREVNPYYVVKALQLYIEGRGYRKLNGCWA